MTQAYAAVTSLAAWPTHARTAHAPTRDLLCGVAPLAASARQVGRELDPDEALKPAERFALAIALLWSWQTGVEVVAEPLRTLAEALFAGLPAEARDAMSPWCFEAWRVIPDRRGPGAVVCSLASSDVGYHVARVCVLGPLGHQPEVAPRGTCMGWLVPVGDEPALLTFYQPHGRRLGRLREILCDTEGNSVFRPGLPADAHPLAALVDALDASRLAAEFAAARA
jgi:hypothetical protein